MQKKEILKRLKEAVVTYDEGAAIKWAHTAVDKGMDESEVETSIEKLKRSGDIFEPRRGFISRI